MDPPPRPTPRGPRIPNRELPTDMEEMNPEERSMEGILEDVPGTWTEETRSTDEIQLGEGSATPRGDLAPTNRKIMEFFSTPGIWNTRVAVFDRDAKPEAPRWELVALQDVKNRFLTRRRGDTPIIVMTPIPSKEMPEMAVDQQTENVATQVAKLEIMLEHEPHFFSRWNLGMGGGRQPWRIVRENDMWVELHHGGAILWLIEDLSYADYELFEDENDTYFGPLSGLKSPRKEMNLQPMVAVRLELDSAFTILYTHDSIVLEGCLLG